MDREILFRGKIKGKDKWVFGFYYYMNETTYAFAEDYEKFPVPTHHYILYATMTGWGLPNRVVQVEVEPDSVGQFTGFTGKEHKYIFEGDILEVFYDDLFPENSVKYTVLFHDGAWCIKADNRDEIERLEKFDCDRGIVVGNIYDNKEE